MTDPVDHAILLFGHVIGHVRAYSTTLEYDGSAEIRMRKRDALQGAFNERI